MKTWTLIAALALLPGCGDNGGGGADDSSGGTANATTDDTPTGGGEDETSVPPTAGHDAIQAWLMAGHYKSWKCETGVQDPISISPHGKQRICSNPILSAHTEATEYPVDSAAVKELYDEAGTTIVGYAVYRHIKAGTGGDSWYWYEQLPLDHPAMPDPETGVIADGPGDSGNSLKICVGCHQATGSDAMHPGHDFVYEQIK
ncbi:MAG TPA: hypothetical protein VGB85_24165 [Nannocystis sp.]|jgi:hypothetical protein